MMELPKRRACAPLLLLLLAVLSACAGRRGEVTTGDGEPAPVDSVAVADDGAATDEAARRAASDRFVRRGRAALRSGRTGEAAALLERAVRVDPSNGRAYLALAEARMARGREEAARGLLERAEALLGDDEEAAARLDSVRAELEGPGEG